MAISSSSSSSFLDTLIYCDEQHHPWRHDHHHNDDDDHFHSHHQDFFWEDEELVSLFTKEQLQTLHSPLTTFDITSRKQAVDWILKVKSHFGFTHLTAILAINYLDRFSSSLHFQEDKPWMIHLLAVTSLSLATKFQETQVPSLLDLQAEDTKYMFDPKNVQKMELLVMSTLEWKMNQVTPISFLDHFVRRLGLNTRLHRDFVKKCENIILFCVSDSRFVGYQPSVLAIAAMLHVIDQVDLFNSVDYQTQILEVLKTNKEKLKECVEMIMEVSHFSSNFKKRKFKECETVHTISSSSSSSSSLTLPSSSGHHHRQAPIKKMAIVQKKSGFGSISCKASLDVAYIP